MVTRKASLALSLTQRVALIHSPSESGSLMYHFQSSTSQIALELPAPACPSPHSWLLFVF
jgi:hypothetical protein